MGTWGREPKDNDTSWDLWAICAQAASHAAEMAFAAQPCLRTTQAKIELAGMVQIIMEAGVSLRCDIVCEAASDIRSAVKDKAWIAGWKKDPTKDLLRIAKAMEDLLPKKFKGSDRVTVLEGWPNNKMKLYRRGK